MKLHYKFYNYHFVLIIFFICVHTNVFAQLFSNGTADNGNLSTQKIISDTTKKKQINTDDKIKISYYSLHDSTKKQLDTSIAFLHRNPILSIWNIDLGNSGSASQSLKFNPNILPNPTLGMYAIEPLLYLWQDTKFYNTTRPYTKVFYNNGGKSEQIISLIHTQNITPNWNISAEYRKINSPGFYKWQKTNHDNFAFTTHYLSTNKQYEIKAGFLYNKLQQDENGGIVSYDYLYNAAYNDKRLIPVNFEAFSTNRSSVTNYIRNVSINLQQQYYFGKKDSVLNADSTEKIYQFKPIFSIKHQLYTTFEYYRYKDVKPDSNHYTKLFPSEFSYRDSVYIKYFHKQIGNTFSLQGDIRFKEKVMQAELGYGIEIENIKNNALDQNYYNNFLFVKINKPSQAEKEWIYHADLKSYFTGNAIGNFLLQAKAGRKFNDKIGEITLGFSQTLQTAPYIFSYFSSNYFIHQNSFSKQTISDINLNYQNNYLKTNVQFHYYLVGNYFYRDTNLMATQYNKIVPILQLQLNKNFKIKTIAFDNQILLQYASTNTPIQLPVFASRHRLAYENKILKKKLLIATGFDFRYNTPYFANDYAPVFLNFVTQYNYKISNVPQCAFFFNFNVKRFRASIALDQLQQLFTRNNINYSNYTAQNFNVRFGLYWTFIN